MPPVKELVIDRARWGQGKLKRFDNGKMCCLGFLSLACGVPEARILNKAFPCSTWAEEYGVNKEFVDRAEPAAGINDSTTKSYTQKEFELIDLFADNGITLSFIGEITNE